MKKLIKKMNDLGWVVCKADEDYYELGKFSPAGQDFNIVVEAGACAKDFIQNLYEVYSDFDVSEETSCWLDETGHGTNGAPYDMKDLYEDMAACRAMILELHDELLENKKE